MQKIVVQLLRAPAGGIRKHVLDIIESLSSDQIKQIFITNMNDADVDLNYLNSFKNIEIYHVNIQESPGLSDLKNLIKIFKILRTKKVDVLHGHGAKGGLYARFLAGPLNAKCIYTPHGGSLHRVHGKIKNIIYDLVEKMMVPLTDVFLFESHYSSDVFAKNICNPGKKTVVNYNGVDLPSVTSSKIYQPGQLLNLASFGLLRHLKGHDIIIETCRLLKEKSIPFRYSIYGTGEFESSLIDLIKKYNLESEIKIFTYSLNVCEEMLKYDFVVHPSRFESFGYVPVEAMSVKVPVIVSHEGGLKEVVDEASGFISVSNTPQSYLEILEKIFTGQISVESKVDHAYTRIQMLFSKVVMIENIRKIYLNP